MLSLRSCEGNICPVNGSPSTIPLLLLWIASLMHTSSKIHGESSGGHRTVANCDQATLVVFGMDLPTTSGYRWRGALGTSG